jgi:hypothetical protein
VLPAGAEHDDHRSVLPACGREQQHRGAVLPAGRDHRRDRGVLPADGGERGRGALLPAGRDIGDGDPVLPTVAGADTGEQVAGDRRLLPGERQGGRLPAQARDELNRAGVAATGRDPRLDLKRRARGTDA